VAPVLYAIYLSLFIKKRIGSARQRDFGGFMNYTGFVQTTS
jgi:hypothetical protein